MKYVALVASLVLVSAAHAEEKYKELFNGKDLTGWEGDKRLWSVQDGLLTGQTTADTKLEKNTFCIWKDGEVGDFELEATFRLEGDNNSGIQYRSKKYPKNGPYAIIGYQADIHPAANYVGMLYDEGGRGIAAERGQKVTLGPGDAKDVKPLKVKDEAPKLSEWNKLEVRAVGNHLVHKLNGEVTVDVTDNDPENAEAKGLLALQVHAGPPMKVQFKSIRLKQSK
jgi:3-keto-disaccharide hydrolase